MTHLPPPPNVRYAPNYPQPAGANVWSIISLISGILGCLGITAIAAIILGVVGLATAGPLRRGRGMALAGIILGVLWIGGGAIAMVAAVKYAPQLATVFADRIAADAKPQTIVFLNNLADGKLDAARAQVDGISDPQLESLNNTLKPLGHCSEIAVNTANVDTDTHGKIVFNFGGEATFEHGKSPIHIRMRQLGTSVMFEEVELR